MSEDQFFERLRGDARSLQYEPDGVTLTRVSARIRSRIAAPVTVAGMLAAWFRPLAVTLTAVALAATMGIAFSPDDDSGNLGDNPVEISMAGDSYSVGE